MKKSIREIATFALVWFAAGCSLLCMAAAQAHTVSPLPASDYTVQPACAAPAPRHMGCLAQLLLPRSAAARAHTHPLGMTLSAPIRANSAAEGAYGLRPQDLRSAYFPGEQPDAPASEPQTIALVDAYNDPDAEADLRTYDEEFGLPECTAGNGCFEQVNQNGETTNLPFPQSQRSRQEAEALCESATAEETVSEAACREVKQADGWALEMSLDIEMAHAVCQNCRIALVEADNAEEVSLEAAENAAAHIGATEISDSWGGEEPVTDSEAFNHPGIVITVAAGDDGYINWAASREEVSEGVKIGGVSYPASSPHVVAVGGTQLALSSTGEARGNETVWRDGGGGCSLSFPAQEWQRDVPDWSSVGCEGRRAVADVAADADPYTGVAVYDSVPYISPGGGLNSASVIGWTPIGGTSVASPIIASMFALAGGAHGVEYPAKTLYSHLGSASLYDVTETSNGKCDDDYASGCTGSMSPLSPFDCGQGVLICNATVGYDGPSGVGAPNGVEAFKPARAPKGGGPEEPLTEACGGPIGAGGEQRVCGKLNPAANAKAGYYFAYNKGTSCTQGKETEPMPEVQGQAIPVSGELRGLEPATEYAYCLVATNASGETVGPALTFTTEPAAPKAPQTRRATNVASESATLNGKLGVQPIKTGWYFEYAAGESCTGAGAKTTPETEDTTLGEPGDEVSAPLTELRPNTEYAACLVAKNRMGFTDGSEIGFHTMPVDPSFGPSSVSCPSQSFCAAIETGGVAATFSGGSWSKPIKIDPYKHLRSVSCSSPSFCVAVGAYGLAMTYTGKWWSTPAAIASVQLESVSCPSTSFCVAVGGLGEAVIYNGSSWSEPVKIDRGSLPKSVSCVSEAFCAAVDSNGNVLTFNGSAWSSPQSIDSGHELTSVSCTSESFCAAVDGKGNAMTLKGGSWSTPANIDSESGLLSVSCVSESFCLTMAEHGKAEVFNGGSWSEGASMGGVAGAAVSCPSESFCVAADTEGIASTFNGISWSAKVILGGNGLNTVSCASESFCVGLDANGRAVTYNGSSWSAPVHIDTVGEPSSVSCPSASFCMMVDYAGDAITYRRGSWSAPAKIASNYLVSVSCFSESFCAAVAGGEFALTYNGSSWSESPKIDEGGLSSVSCPSASFCVAVDGGRSLTFNGSSWSAPGVIGIGNSARSVSCVSISFCMAASEEDGEHDDVATFNGSTWTKTAAIDSRSGLRAVSCAAESFCAAIDWFGSILTYNGSSWNEPADVNEENIPTSVSCPTASFCAVVDASGNALIYSSPVPQNTSPPTISGSAVQNESLTEQHGSWSNDPTSYTYQWEDCDSAGANCSPTTGATAQTYTLAQTDVGHTIRVRETASNASGTGATTSSAATAIVQAASSGGGSGPGSGGGSGSGSGGSGSGSGSSGSGGGSDGSGSGSGGPSGGTTSAGTAPLATVSAAGVRGDLALIPVSCPGNGSSSCTVTFTLTVVEKLRQGRLVAVSAATATRHRASKVKLVLRTVIVGHETVTLAAGESQVVHLALNATGRRLLDSQHALAVKLTVNENGVRPSEQIVRFKAPTKKARVG